MRRCGEWTEENWKTLIYTIHQKKCILMLGPDASAELVNGKPRAITEILAEGLASTFEPQQIEDWRLDCSNLAQVSKYYCLKHGRNALGPNIRDFYAMMEHQTNDLYRDLATLPFYLAITSTPDYMFYEALEQEHKSPHTAAYNFRGDTQDIVEMGTFENPLIYYLYGSLEDTDSLVLTENDILDFLARVILEKPPLPANILSEFQGKGKRKSKSLLFLGFGFKHWYLRILLHVLQGEHTKESRSFALEQFTPQNQEEFERTILFFSERDYNIQISICDTNLSSFVKELRERYKKNFPDGSAKPRTSAIKSQDGPSVFLCHAKENREYVKYLRKQLNNAGFRAWFDEEDILGGDRWDAKIKKTIEEIDYFVVLQSHVMAEKPESYFYKEIHLALERQTGIAENFRFIIPVKIEKDCPLLRRLKNLQTIDLTESDGLYKLISIIRDDLKLREDRG